MAEVDSNQTKPAWIGPAFFVSVSINDATVRANGCGSLIPEPDDHGRSAFSALL
jgi:hypothetical protein